MLQMYPRLKWCSYIMKITGVFGILVGLICGYFG